MQYTQVLFSVDSELGFVQDVLTQQLADIGFESFVEQADGRLAAYIPTCNFDTANLKSMIDSFPFEGVRLWETTLCEDKDWNEEWEQNSFQPIQIGSDCLIHAPFHKNLPQCKYDIVINPKMAFGTGTHQTTSLILSRLLQTNLQGKSLLDMGCGTAVLGILAKKLGASPVTAIDIDNWCTENAAENCLLNGISDMEILLGDARLLEGRSFDIILANINRNILLMDMSHYAASLNNGGILIMSGFYIDDIPVLMEEAKKHGLVQAEHLSKDNWAMLELHKE